MQQENIIRLARKASGFLLALLLICSCDNEAVRSSSSETLMPAEVMADKIKGGLTGQILGNLNGLPYEFKFVNEPGDVEAYLPGLPDGARTDDDTDIEWMYICYMDSLKQLKLEKEMIPEIWKRHVNYKVWASNLTARWLMELGFVPDETGNAVLNPWAAVNLGGQFCSETFGLTAPGMPGAAVETGLWYTGVIVDGEPAQCARYVTAMIAEAFRTENLDQIMRTGIQAVHPGSETYRDLQDVIGWHAAYPGDWRKTRAAIKEKFHTDNGRLPINNAGVNISAVTAALLYGDGDFTETMILAFNMGWDADCNAATVGTILGIIYGYEWMEQQGWEIKDRYWNTTRPGLPEDETISSFAGRITRLAEQSVIEQGGKVTRRKGMDWYRIPYIPVGNERIPDGNQPESLLPFEQKYQALKKENSNKVLTVFAANDPKEVDLLKYGYLSVVLNLYPEIMAHHPENFTKFLELFHAKPVLPRTFLRLPDAIAAPLKERLADAGIREVEISPQTEGAVEFHLSGYTDAERVFVGGTFNDWEAWTSPMARSGNGWTCRMDLDPGTYAYKFVVEGQSGSVWVFDPANPVIEKNHDGYENSILQVPWEYRIAEKLPFAGTDSLPLTLDLYVPEGVQQPVPCILAIQGGGYAPQDGQRFKFFAEYIAESGFAAALISYRGRPDVTYETTLGDVKDAVKFVRRVSETYSIDPERIGAMGRSAGGALAVLAAVTGEQNGDGYEYKGDTNEHSGVANEHRSDVIRDSSSIQAVVAYAGVFDFISRFTDQQQIDLQPGVQAKIESVTEWIGPDFSADDPHWQAASAIYHVDPYDPPVLFIHCRDDSVVPWLQSLEMFTAMTEQGIACDTIFYDSGGHGFKIGSRDLLLEPMIGYFREQFEK